MTIMLDTHHGGNILRTRSILRASPSLDLPSAYQHHPHHFTSSPSTSSLTTTTPPPLSGSSGKQLIPWPGMRFSCMKILHLYCKVFGQMPLFELILRKTCSGCKCPRDSHAVFLDQLQNVSERLGFKPNTAHLSSINNAFDPTVFNYAWAPPGLKSLAKIDEFFSGFPPEKVPRIGTPGERYRDKQILAQLPKQDLALTYCKHVPPQHHGSYEDFVSARNEIALDIGYVVEAPERSHLECYECEKEVQPGRLCVVSPRFGGIEMLEKVGERSSSASTLLTTRVWHPACFRCKHCHEPLVDLAHCVHDGAIYCERHYAELLKPRCAACDEVCVNDF